MVRGSARVLFFLTAISLAFQAASGKALPKFRAGAAKVGTGSAKHHNGKRSEDYPYENNAAYGFEDTNPAFHTVLLGNVLPGRNSSDCEDFVLDGPFNEIHIRMGANTVRGLTTLNIAQNTTTILAGAKEQVGGVEVPGGEFAFANNERITNFAVGTWPDTDTVASVAFSTQLGNIYHAFADSVAKGDVADLRFYSVPVGGGILARIRGTTCSNGEFGSIGFDILRELESIVITDIDYEGFSNNIMPADHGTPMSIGQVVADARNSSAEQRVVLSTSDSVTYSRTVKIDGAIMFGNTLTVSGKVGIPLVAEGSVTVATTWSLTVTLSNSKTTESTTTRGAMYWLGCAAGKYCTADAFINVYTLSVNVEATFTASTKDGGVYQWVQKGTYDTADSQTVQFNVSETAGDDRSDPITRPAPLPKADAADQADQDMQDMIIKNPPNGITGGKILPGSGGKNGK